MTHHCECGCGTEVPTRKRSWRHFEKGTPKLRFVHGHNSRGTPTPTPALRFWSKVDKSGECWLWTASTNAKGYGHFWINGRYEQAHRYAYLLVVGAIPDGMHVDHLCRTVACVNPEHLEPVTPQENSRRRREFESTTQRSTDTSRSTK